MFLKNPAVMVGIVFSLTLLFFQGTGVLAQSPRETPGTAARFQFTETEAFLKYLRVNRQNTAIVSFSLNTQGQVDQTDPVTLHNANQPMPLASVVKIIHLAAYAKAVQDGRMDPNRLVTLAEWERTYLPGTDGFAHGAALDEMGIPIDEFGFAVDQQQTVTVDQMVRSMIRFSDNAVPDWLRTNIGIQTFQEVIQLGGLTSQELPPSGTGSFLILENHEKGLISEQTVAEIRNLTPEGLTLETQRLQDRYSDPDWRAAELLWRFENQNALGNRFLSKVVEDVLAKGTAADFGGLFLGVLNGNFISSQVSAIMREKLETSFRIAPDLYTVFGNKGGSLDTGIFNTAGYSVAAGGDFAGKRRITVVFQKNLPAEDFDLINEPPFIRFIWNDRLATERDFAAKVQRAFAVSSQTRN